MCVYVYRYVCAALSQDLPEDPLLAPLLRDSDDDSDTQHRPKTPGEPATSRPKSMVRFGGHLCVELVAQ